MIDLLFDALGAVAIFLVNRFQLENKQYQEDIQQMNQISSYVFVVVSFIDLDDVLELIDL